MIKKSEQPLVKLLIFIISMSLLPSLYGCAEVLADLANYEQRRKIPIDSNPQGAKVYYDRRLIGTTPTYIAFTECNDTLGTHVLKIAKEGYINEIQTFNDKPDFAGVSTDYPGAVMVDLIRDKSQPLPTTQVTKVTPKPKQVRPSTAKIKKWVSKATGQKWAVVAGVSKYKNRGSQITNLRYAAKDAEAMADFLKSSNGGAFDNVYVMLDEDVTYKNMRYALFDYLGQALEEDMVLFFFAGHGAPDPNEPKNLYLLTYDTEPESVSSSAFPMWDVETALKRYIKAETVVMLTDACHSGGINPSVGTRGITVEANPTNEAILNLAHSPGMVSITASEAREVSHESKKWGGGHGVFTHFLLEGLKGKADVDGDRIVSLGEMIDYTSEQVRRATRNKQHPDVSGNFDRNMPLATTK